MDHATGDDGADAPSIRPVILCGGAGARLWPVSTPARPKPFHRLTGRDSLLQETVRRLTGPGLLDPVVVCAAEHTKLVDRQMKAIGRSCALTVIETTPSGTAAAAALGALAAHSLDPDALVLIAPADHAVSDPGAFREALWRGAFAAGERIVLFGARPDRVEAGYGHILPSGDGQGASWRSVRRFIEKPDPHAAAGMRAQDGWLWNTGLFLSIPNRLLEEIDRWAPQISRSVRSAWSSSRTIGRRRTVSVETSMHGTSTSLDRAVIESSSALAVVECAMGWRDVGCWLSIWSGGARDTSDNRLNGPATVVDASRCLVWSSGPPVAVIGLSDIVVVTTADGVLVMPRERAQDLGDLRRAPGRADLHGSA